MFKFLLPLCLAITMTAHPIPNTDSLKKMTARFAPTRLEVDVSKLNPGDRKALAKLIEAAHLMDDIFLVQLWSGNESLYEKLKQDTSPLGKARLHLFWISKGPWSDLDEHRAFLPGVPEKKPAGANFYPEDMTREEFEAWVSKLSPEEAALAKGFFSIIQLDPNSRKLRIVPYYEAYRSQLKEAAKRLEEAASLTENASLKKFLHLRAKAFLDDDYFDSDVAWMDLDAPIDITIGPYETYNDEIFGYKAGFEAYVNLKDDEETEKLKDFSKHLQEVENNLPIDDRYKNPKLGTTTPIRVVNEVISAGDGAHGVQTAAYNLPNDERVIQQKGSKKVMLKNVQQAKFENILVPISKTVLPQSMQADVNFEWFFTHILAHELSHGIGPHEITIEGRKTSPRHELKDLYSTIEEAKADVTGLYMLQYFFNKKILPGGSSAEKALYTTYLASSFRTLRFGITEAHGRGMALQFNYLTDKGAFVKQDDGRFVVDFAKIKPAILDLTRDLLTIEAQGDYQAAKTLLSQSAVIRPPLAEALQRLQSIPTDIEPIFVTADQIAPRNRH